MSRVTASTWAPLVRPVGNGQRNDPQDVLNLQRLLSAAQVDVGALDSKWGPSLAGALVAFREKSNPVSNPLVVDPDSDEVVLLCQAAGIAIELPKDTGIAGIAKMHQWFVDRKTQYDPDALPNSGTYGARTIYGLSGNNRWAVQLQHMAIAPGPLLMDCTTYVNLMLSVRITGCAHYKPYEASCKDFGGDSKIHCAKDRYSFTPVVIKVGNSERCYVENLDQLTTVTTTKTLYALEVATSKPIVTHMALLYDGHMWECTQDQPGSACTARSIATFMKAVGSSRVYVYEQSSSA